LELYYDFCSALPAGYLPRGAGGESRHFMVYHKKARVKLCSNRLDGKVDVVITTSTLLLSYHALANLDYRFEKVGSALGRPAPPAPRRLLGVRRFGGLGVVPSGRFSCP